MTVNRKKKAGIIKQIRSLARILKEEKFTIAVCESCTGGMLGSLITSLPGSSGYFYGGIIAYSNMAKKKFGVRRATLLRYGAVSEQTAREMAKAAKNQLNTDIGIGITGIAGPGGGVKGKPVGLVYIAFAFEKIEHVVRCVLKGSRDQIRFQACTRALDVTLEQLCRYYRKA